MTGSAKMASSFVQQLAQAIQSHEPLPAFDQKLSLAEAYALQHELTGVLCEDGPGGIKAGVTAPPIQQYFGLDHALIASLYPNARYASGATIPFVEGQGIELEVATIVDADGRPKAIAPAIELVFVKFSNQEDMTAPNLVAYNLGADAYIIGDFVPWSEDFSDLKSTLLCDGEQVSEANMNDAIGGPKSATDWMYQEALARGFACPEDTLFMTGACGQLVPSKPGKYELSIPGLGALTFTVQSPS